MFFEVFAMIFANVVTLRKIFSFFSKNRVEFNDFITGL